MSRLSSSSGPVSPATISLLSLGFQELRKDAAQLLGAGWPEPVRRRAHELATALWQASSRRPDLVEIASIARSLAGLAALPREKAAPLRPALREKFDELLDGAARLVARVSKRSTA